METSASSSSSAGTRTWTWCCLVQPMQAASKSGQALSAAHRRSYTNVHDARMRCIPDTARRAIG
eukprot:8998225-Pyramimonas_sp.AAC.1